MSSDCSASMTTPPHQTDLSSSASLCARSRNAQAQADLRARRKAYLAELEASNASLARQNKDLGQERHLLHQQIHTLKGQVKTLKDSLSMQVTSTTGMDSLLAAVESERSKVKRLRRMIRQVAAVEAQDTDSEQEEASHSPPLCKRSRASTSRDSTDGGLELGHKLCSKHDAESVTTHTTASSSPPTPPRMETWQDGPSRNTLDLLHTHPADKHRHGMDMGSTVHCDETPPASSYAPWGLWTHNNKADATQLGSAGQVQEQDDVLSRFLSSFTSHPTPTGPPLPSPHGLNAAMTSNPALERPMRAHYHSASIFLVLFLWRVAVDAVRGRWRLEGSSGRHGCRVCLDWVCLIRTLWS